MGTFGQTEQFNLISKGGMGHLESLCFMPEKIKKNLRLQESNLPHVRYIDPEVGVWHTVTPTVNCATGFLRHGHEKRTQL